MACEIIIRNIDNVNSSVSGEQERGLYKRGYPVEARDIPHNGWGNDEGLPNFITVIITDATRSEMMQYVEDYYMGQIDWSVTSSNVITDEWELEAFMDNIPASGLGSLVKSKIENFVERWNGIAGNFTANSVALTFIVFNVLKSKGFWEVESLVGATISEDYNSTTGIHSVEIDYTNFKPNIDRDKVRQFITEKLDERNASNVSENGYVVSFDMHRTELFNAFKKEIRARYNSNIWRRRYYLGSITMDNLVSFKLTNGVPMEITKAQALSYFNDKKDE